MNLDTSHRVSYHVLPWGSTCLHIDHVTGNKTVK